MKSLPLAFALALAGCHGSVTKPPAAPGRAWGAETCATVASRLAAFGDVVDEASADARTRAVDYAGLLEILLTFERAAADLDRQLGGLTSDGDLAAKVRAARTSLSKSAEFAHGEAEAVDKHARQIAPLAQETQQAWASLKSACEAKRSPPDCGGVRDVIAKFDASETAAQHERATFDLTALRVTTPAVARARDRAVAASKAVQTAIKARAGAAGPIPKRWGAVQKDLSGSVNNLAAACGKSPTADGSGFIVSDRPDPRKLTVLVHVKPPQGIERALHTLARAATDTEEREFYEARADGAFGSGFFIVKRTERGPDVLVVTNRHVVDLGDRATLELADGTALGAADVVYASPTHDLAILRPAQKLAVKEGFSFAPTAPKDQQTVIATGFPGLVGRPSYQTTRGYVSNEGFRLDDGTRPLTYVQHTAPIDPGSSGGPLTDEAGRVLGVNTMKVTGREAVGLAVPSMYVLETLRIAALVETRTERPRAARLACLSFIAELGATEPRPIVLEQMISNRLVGVAGLDAAGALANEEGFEELWNSDSVRAMRIATLMRIRASLLSGGGPSVLETCSEGTQRGDNFDFKVRLANFETRSVTLRWEQGRFKIDAVEERGGPAAKPAGKRLPAPGPPAAVPPSKRLAPPGGKR